MRPSLAITTKRISRAATVDVSDVTDKAPSTFWKEIESKHAELDVVDSNLVPKSNVLICTTARARQDEARQGALPSEQSKRRDWTRRAQTWLLFFTIEFFLVREVAKKTLPVFRFRFQLHSRSQLFTRTWTSTLSFRYRWMLIPDSWPERPVQCKTFRGFKVQTLYDIGNARSHELTA